MPKKFYEMLSIAFQEPAYVMTPYSSELISISKMRTAQAPEAEAIRSILEEQLCGYALFTGVADCDGTCFAKDGLFAILEKSQHSLAFTPKDFIPSTVLLNLGWRGRVPLTEDERERYLNVLSVYFSSVRVL